MRAAFSSTRSARFATLLLIAAANGLAGCATPPPPAASKTTVVLLPDEDGNVGAVSVASAAGIETLDQAYGFTAVDGSKVALAGIGALRLGSVEAAYGELLQAQPTQPRTFILYFRLDKTELTAESKAMLPTVLATARARKPTEITVFGHADASGRSEKNWKLSAERANVVAGLLRASDPEVGRIDVQYFGDKAPLVQTGTRAAEQRNRRAEVLIL